jgi:hypothetical protein
MARTANPPPMVKKIIKKKTRQISITNELHGRINVLQKRCAELGYQLDLESVVEFALEKAVTQTENYLKKEADSSSSISSTS